MAAKLTKEQKEAFAQWKEHCREVQSLTAESLSVVKESPLEKERRIKRLLSNYDEFCEYYFAHFLTRPPGRSSAQSIMRRSIQRRLSR